MQDVGRLYFLLALAQAAHSIEEMLTRLYEFFWTATGLFHQYVPAIPQFRMRAETFGALNMTFIAVLLAVASAVAARKPWALFFASVVAAIEILNGAGHLTGTIVFGGYVPGAGTAPFLLVLGILTLRASRQG